MKDSSGESPASHHRPVHWSHPVPGVALITIDSPPSNALGRPEVDSFHAALDAVEHDARTRALVVTGTGNAFSAGADLKEQLAVAAEDRKAYYQSRHHLGSIIERIQQTPLPVIASVNGYALGGGLELALACDIRLAGTQAYFVCSAVNVGLILSWDKLPQLVGLGRATEMLLSGRRYDAVTAERWGLVSSVHEPGALLDASVRLAERIAGRPPLSVRAIKAAIGRSFELSAAQAARLQAEHFALLVASEDHQEALSAFSQKREPRFVGR